MLRGMPASGRAIPSRRSNLRLRSMQGKMDDTRENPYASPQAVSERLTDSEREIRTVARVFRWIGWVGVILYFPVIVMNVGALIYSLLVEPVNSPMVLAGASLLHGGILFVSFTFLRTAKGLANKHPLSGRAAKVLSCILLLGFPLFTIVGAICLHKVRRHFSAFCQGNENIRDSGTPA